MLRNSEVSRSELSVVDLSALFVLIGRKNEVKRNALLRDGGQHFRSLWAGTSPFRGQTEKPQRQTRGYLFPQNCCNSMPSFIPPEPSQFCESSAGARPPSRSELRVSRLNRIMSFKPSRIWSYGIALVSVALAWIFAQSLGLGPGFPATPFFCAIVLSAWYGGVGPALFAIALSHLGFFLHHHLSFSVGNLMYTASNILLAGLGIAQRNAKESLRHARDDLKRTVQDLQATNEALLAESSERRQAEEALRQAQAELTRVSRVTTMGELTASLTHEIKQPIAAAIMDARTCLRWLRRNEPNVTEASEAALRIVRDVTRATDIISRLQLQFQKGSSKRELVDVNEMIREMIALLESEAKQYKILVLTVLSADLPQVMGDRVQLQQVLMNLMINSIDAMKSVDGMRELAIKSERADNEQLKVSVSDTGIGLPPQQEEQIFNAFYTTKPHGTGMGLRISRSIIESHGGRLWASGASGRGATFQFTLPAPVAAQT
jgi:signal transduction histidine kinase